MRCKENYLGNRLDFRTRFWKGGGAGAKFAAALAQAAIVVLDFVANFLLLKLGKGLKKLAGKLKGIARRLLKKRRGLKGKKRRKGAKRKATKGNKKPKGKKKGKDEKDRDKKKQDAQRRVRKAAAEAKRALGRPTPAKQARATIGRIARKHKVRSSVQNQQGRWSVTFKVNPDARILLRDNDNEEKKIEQLLKRAESSRRQLDRAIHQDWQTIVARLHSERGGEGPRPFKDAETELKQRIEAAGGREAYIDQLKAAGRLEAVDPNLAGEAFEAQALAAHRADIGDRGSVFSSSGLDENLSRRQRERIGKTGFDSAAVLSEEGAVEIGEAKRGTPVALKGKTTKKSAQNPESPRIPLAPGQKPADLVQQPGVADRIVDGEMVRSADGRDFENKVSALSKNLEKNLGLLEQQLKAAMNAEKDAQVRRRMAAELKTLQEIRRGEAGTIRVRLSTLKNPTPSEVAAIGDLFEAAARRLGNVKIQPIIVAVLADEHEKVGGR